MLLFACRVTVDPWTALGSGTEQVAVAQDCEKGAFVNPKCLVESSSYCNRFAVLLSAALSDITGSVVSLTLRILCRSLGWREACCTFPCQNGGSRAFPGDCHCSCPYEYTGFQCTARMPHVRLDLQIGGENEESFTKEKSTFINLGTADLAAINVQSIEIDTIKNFASHRRATSINMV